jgi:aminocarboxymuconate-semialdehyde decarboxylase
VTKAAKKQKLATTPKAAAAKAAAARAAKVSRAKVKSKTASRSKGPTPKPVVIDFHAHIVVPEVLDFAYQHSMYAQGVAGKGVGGHAEGIPEAFLTRMTDMTLRLKDMDAMGVDMQVVSPSILQQCTYFAEPQEALKMERIGNDCIAETVAQYPDRLIGLGSVPMQDVDIAVQELTRCVRDLKLRGIIVSSNVNGIELGDARLRPFWAAAERLGATIFIHPAGSADPRLRQHRMVITVGQPLEEAFAQASLVYEGIMDAFPGMKIVIAHGGGFLPFYTGRVDNDYRLGRGGQNLKGDFSSYLPRFFYDTVLFNPDMLDYLVGKVPPSHVLLASDYPFAEKRPVEFVRRAKKISKKDQDAILGVNAARMMGISI